MNITEEWRPVVGFVGYYEVSNQGNVRSVSRVVRGQSKQGGYHQMGKVVAKYKDVNGYFCAHLCRDGISINKKIHRMVAEAFIPNPDNLPVINHKDEVKTNNRVENLEWCTQQYNVTYGNAIQKCQDATRKPIYQLDKNTTEIVKIWKWVGDITKELGYRKNRVVGWCQRYAEAEGYIWCYAEDYKEGYKSGKSIKTTRFAPRALYKIDPSTLKILDEYKSSEELRAGGYETTMVYDVCEGKTRKHKGYYWCYVDDYNPDSYQPKKMSHFKRKVIQFDLKSGEELGRWESLREMSKATGYLGAHVGKCCRGLRPDAYGYGWRFAE